MTYFYCCYLKVGHKLQRGWKMENMESVHINTYNIINFKVINIYLYLPIFTYLIFTVPVVLVVFEAVEQVRCVSILLFFQNSLSPSDFSRCEIGLLAHMQMHDLTVGQSDGIIVHRQWLSWHTNAVESTTKK